MSSLVFKIEKICTESLCSVRNWLSVIVIFFGCISHAWEIDFSRRQVEFKKMTDQVRGPASESDTSTPSTGEVSLTSFLGAEPRYIEASPDVVILNTENGFVPSQLHLQKGKSYQIHVVNTHPKEKNLSIVMDDFTVKEATLFGVNKSFTLSPRVDGVFVYQCPETGKEGKIYIYSSNSSQRSPASK